MKRLVIIAMGADLATWALVPEPVRAAAESNPLVTSFAVAFLLKFAAILAIFGLLTRLKHHRWVAVGLVVAITLVGAGSNLRAVRADGPSHPEPVLRWAPVIVPPSPTASPLATDRPTPSGHTQGASVSGQTYALEQLGPVQFACLDHIVMHESHWRVDALNRTSGAYGIPQALPGSKMASAGADWRTNPVTQVRWMLGYVHGRYGSPCEAWTFWLGHHWY